MASKVQESLFLTQLVQGPLSVLERTEHQSLFLRQLKQVTHRFFAAESEFVGLLSEVKSPLLRATFAGPAMQTTLSDSQLSHEFKSTLPSFL